MKILVIGSGGREHALAWKLQQSPRVEKIWCAPGNGGIAELAECVRVDPGDVSALVGLADKVQPDLTVVGPELPLVNGLADEFRRRDWAVVGPSRQAARLEGSKIFAKEFLERHHIPTARMFEVFNVASEAYAALRSVEWPIVIKADGLCAGKGVFLPSDRQAAKDFLERLMEKDELGPGGKRVLLEEVLEGEELSFIVLTDGQRYASLAPTRDHKRVFDGNRGPNTGGMGAYSCDDLLPDGLRKQITSTIVEPTLRGLQHDGIDYQGFLYIGLMLTPSGPKVLEFNCRLGDPETQAIVPRMDFDLAEILNDTAKGKLEPAKLRWKPGASVCVILASGGYPGKFENGKRIEGLTALGKYNGVQAFHAGTTRDALSFLTAGGRVLGVTSAASTMEQALASVYGAVSRIHFEGMHYRKDIGAQATRLHATGN